MMIRASELLTLTGFVNEVKEKIEADRNKQSGDLACWHWPRFSQRIDFPRGVNSSEVWAIRSFLLKISWARAGF